MKHYISLITLIIFLLNSCSSATPMSTPTEFPTETSIPTLLPTATHTPTPILTATPEPEIFVPNVGSLTWLPGEGNRMGDTLELGEGAPDYFKNQIIGSILAGHAKLVVREDTSLLSKDPGVTFTNDEWIRSNFNVDPNNLNAFISALRENDYVMPEGFILPAVREASMGSSMIFRLEKYPEFKLDTVVLQLVDQKDFTEKRLAAFNSDPSNDAGSIKNGSFVMENVWNPQGGEGYVFGTRLEDFSDGNKRLVLMMATTTDMPWREVGINPNDPSAAGHVEQWVNYFPFIFSNMKNASQIPGDEGKIPSILYFNDARDQIPLDHAGNPIWSWDGNFDRTATSDLGVFLSSK